MKYFKFISAISNWLKSLNWLIFFHLIAMLIYIGMLLVLYYNNVSTSESLANAKSQFYTLADKILDSQASNDLANTEEALKVIFSSIDRDNQRAASKYGYANLLEDYATNTYSGDYKANIEKVKFINNLVIKEKRAEPYSQIPNEQGRLLRNLDESIQSNQKDNAEFNLRELNSVLQLNYKHIQDLESENAWSIPLAIFGVILTLIFGVISLAKR